MADSKTRHVISNLAGGRNGYDPPWEIADNECADAVNIDFYGTPFARKRGGTVTPPGQTGITLTQTASSLARHVPGTDATHAELWATDDAATPNLSRLAGPTWMTPTQKDLPTGNGWDFSYASINGKLMVAYKSAQPRMHLWDGSTLRRAGLATPAAISLVQDTGTAADIAFDNIGQQGFGPTTLVNASFSVGASSVGFTALLVGIQESAGLVNNVTFNGVALNIFQRLAVSGADGITSISHWFLGNATPGTHPLVISCSGLQSLQYTAASYRNTNSGLAAASFGTGASMPLLTVGTPTVYPNGWAVGFFTKDNRSEAFTAQANTTIRAQANGMCYVDSNQAALTPTTVYLGTQWPTNANCCGFTCSLIVNTPAYSTVKRYYRVRWTRQISGITQGRSEPGPITAYTPSGTSLALFVYQPTPPGEGETHWEVEAAIDGVSFYRVATLPIATTVYTDNQSTTTYGQNPLSALTGFYTLLPAAKYIAADQGRLLTFGSYTTTDRQNDVVVSAVIGASNISDEERVDTTTNYRIGLDENDSGVPTGLIGPVNGGYLVFKDRQTWLLTATGNISQPYNATALSKTVGAVGPTAMDKGEDSTGNACVYWMSHRGLYRWGLTGLQYIGRNMEDFVLPGGNSQAQINLAASHVVSVVRYFPDKRQVWCWWATGASNDPNQLGIYDVITGGWTRVPTSDKLAQVRCAVMFSNTLGTTVSLDLKPYVGMWFHTVTIAKADTGTDDFGTPFQAYVITKAMEPGGQGFYGSCGDSDLLAKVAPGVTIAKTTIADFGAQYKNASTVLNAPILNAPILVGRVSVPFQDAGIANVRFVQHQIGDGTPVSNSWSLERLITPIGPQGAVAK